MEANTTDGYDVMICSFLKEITQCILKLCDEVGKHYSNPSLAI
jgi:hypothetical protein